MQLSHAEIVSKALAGSDWLADADVISFCNTKKVGLNKYSLEKINMLLTEAILDAEEDRRRRCISRLRHNDMGEASTNLLMERLSDNPQLLDEGVGTTIASTRAVDISTSSALFKITESNQRDSVMLETRVGSVELSDIMAARLRSLYVNHHNFNLLTPTYLSNFSRSTFLLLLRYSYVDPGFKRQGYLAPQYFEAISRAFNAPIDLEAFAAAFNTTVPTYCSLFPDVESPFGSIGSFFDLQSLGDMHLIQVSPPRIGSITKQAIEHCIQLLRETTSTSYPYYIITLTPQAWPDINDLIETSGYSIWVNRSRKGDTIEYHDVIKNKPNRYPMPRVSVLSNIALSGGLLDTRTSQILHSVFSSR